MCLISKMILNEITGVTTNEAPIKTVLLDPLLIEMSQALLVSYKI